MIIAPKNGECVECMMYDVLLQCDKVGNSMKIIKYEKYIGVPMVLHNLPSTYNTIMNNLKKLQIFTDIHNNEINHGFHSNW